jgi:hypothetical protein
MAIISRSLANEIAFEQISGYYFFNAYTTINFVDGYLRTRLNTLAWEEAVLENQEASLVQATEIIERLNFSGEKADSSQRLFFPRDKDTAVPDAIQKACAEIALALLDGVDPEMEYQNLLMTSQGYGSVRSQYDRRQYQPHVINGVPSQIAWRYLKPYLRDPETVNISRVS